MVKLRTFTERVALHEIEFEMSGERMVGMLFMGLHFEKNDFKLLIGSF